MSKGDKVANVARWLSWDRWQKHWDKSDLQPAMVRQVACLTGAPGFNLPLKCHRPSIAKEKLKSEIYGRYGS